MKYFRLNFLYLLLLQSCQVSFNENHIESGTKLLNEADIFGAEREFDDELRMNGNSIEALRGKLRCLSYYSGKTNEAISVANKIIKLIPDSSLGYAERGTIYGAKGEHAMAINDYKHALKLGTPYPTIMYFNIGENMRLLNKYNEAITYYKQVILIDSLDSESYSKIGQSYLEYGNKDSACYFLCIAKGIGDINAAKLYKENCER